MAGLDPAIHGATYSRKTRDIGARIERRPLRSFAFQQGEEALRGAAWMAATSMGHDDCG